MKKNKALIIAGASLLAVCAICIAVVASCAHFKRTWELTWELVLMSVLVAIGIAEIAAGILVQCHNKNKSPQNCEQLLPLLMALPKENRSNCEITIIHEKNSAEYKFAIKSTSSDNTDESKPVE